MGHPVGDLLLTRIMHQTRPDPVSENLRTRYPVCGLMRPGDSTFGVWTTALGRETSSIIPLFHPRVCLEQAN